jgi:tetratricopeptide (TPR) repeat protein
MQAARAAYLLGRSADALRYATEGMAAAAGADIDVERLPQRTLAEAAYGAYAAERGAGADAAATRELFQRTETALTSLLGREPADPWVHVTLANLYEWEGNLVEARDALMRGIDRVPNDAGMVAQLARVARELADVQPPLETFVELVRRHPEQADARFFEAEERFYGALAQLEAGVWKPAEFRAAEAGFRKGRELNPSYEASCKGWEVTCRNALGWCLYNQGDVAGAEAAFRSMDELLERGLEWQYEGRLLSGVLGLAFCSKAYYEAEDWLAAAGVNEFLRHYVPEDVTYANDAGLFFRDAAVELELEGRNFCYAAQGLVKSAETLAAWRGKAGIGPGVAAGSVRERDLFRAAANARIGEARALMRKSADAYRAAAALAPDDVRIVNDTALVMLYYLHADIAEAKAMLLRCVELGAAQIGDAALDDDARFNLEGAWGDAHQNLGVLAYVYEHDEAAALAWFEKSIEIDAARGDVLDFWLPFLRGEIAAGGHDDYIAVKDWGKPCE